MRMEKNGDGWRRVGKNRAEMEKDREGWRRMEKDGEGWRRIEKNGEVEKDGEG